MGKGSLWRVEQQYKQNLIIALTRSSYHPNTSAMEKVTASLKASQHNATTVDTLPATQRSNSATSNSTRPLDAELFPKLSKIMANMNNGAAIGKSADMTMGDDYPTDIDMDGDDGAAATIAIHANGNERNVRLYRSSGGRDIDVQQTMNVEQIARDWGVDSIDDVNAATAMLALKHGPKVFTETFHAGYIAIILLCATEK